MRMLIIIIGIIKAYFYDIHKEKNIQLFFLQRQTMQKYSLIKVTDL